MAVSIARRKPQSPAARSLIIIALWIVMLMFFLYIIILYFMSSTLLRKLSKKGLNTIRFDVIRDSEKITVYDDSSNEVEISEYLASNKDKLLASMLNSAIEKEIDIFQVVIKKEDGMVRVFDERSLLVMIAPVNNKTATGNLELATVGDIDTLCRSIEKVAEADRTLKYPDFLDAMSVYLQENLPLWVYVTSEHFIVELRNRRNLVFFVDVAKYIKDNVGPQIAVPMNFVLLILYKMNEDYGFVMNMNLGLPTRVFPIPASTFIAKRETDRATAEKVKKLYSYEYREYIDPPFISAVVDKMKHSNAFNMAINDLLKGIYKKKNDGSLRNFL